MPGFCNFDPARMKLSHADLPLETTCIVASANSLCDAESQCIRLNRIGPHHIRLQTCRTIKKRLASECCVTASLKYSVMCRGRVDRQGREKGMLACSPESHKGIAHDADGSRFMADCCCPTDVLCVGNVAQALHSEGKDQAAVHRDCKEECQVEAMIPLHHHTPT